MVYGIHEMLKYFKNTFCWRLARWMIKVSLLKSLLYTHNTNNILSWLYYIICHFKKQCNEIKRRFNLNSAFCEIKGILFWLVCFLCHIQIYSQCKFKLKKKNCYLTCFSIFLRFQTWDPWNVPLALSCALRVFRLLSQVTLLRFASVPHI